jgi:metal-responsive CopG/Arc/MetJ family transcriptional regulator
MRTVQLTLDEDLVAEVDKIARKLGTTRSAFTREALRGALARLRDRALERKHREGYLKKPASAEEFGAWESEQAWGK